MEIIKTKRLILRPVTADDADLLIDCVNAPGHMRFMYHWQSEIHEEARRFLAYAERVNAQSPQTDYEYACIGKEDHALCACVSLALKGDTARVGWFAHHARTGCGYVTEAARALIAYAFDKLGAERVTAACDARNQKSAAVMERLHMRREGVAAETRPLLPGDERRADEWSYALLKSEWEDLQDYARLSALPVRFDGFMDVPELTDGELRLICLKKAPADPEKNRAPSYAFCVTRGGENIGSINLRVAYAMPRLYYGGQIGYEIAESYRGHGYAARACRLLVPVMRYHGMGLAIITNRIENTASRRVCEKLGATLLRVSRVPEWHDMYEHGARYINIFEWRFGAEEKQ